MRSVGKFYDDRNFPRGFNRSGVFTINESNLLETFGRTMHGLSDGSLLPSSEAEKLFVDEITGLLTVQSNYAKCWIKYVTRTSTKVRSYTLCVSQRSSNSSYGDDDLTIDTDGDSDLDI
ncbi:hypothetical protein C9I98_07050 [Photobacterium sanctipauli]|uniref:Macrodomain Ori protein n=1 Tax=Photobacterium sanctipauli TaxID=1342794 RepID=A0A2T3NWJ5_9GAMM|nr:DUF413 domain-containing protein [Photobacterium sanctipauli]PSW20602.1 hypothetical protein C9I98_07050 [Photobacterium sanctipauli]